MSDLTTSLPYQTLEPDPADDAEARELAVLAHVHNAQQASVNLSQRSMATALGMSVGLTNAILKRLADKGFLMIRRINANNAHYLVTPVGIEQISRRSYRYLRRTVGHVVRYKELLRDWCRAQKLAGITRVYLVGRSDLEFLIEWCAHKEGLEFLHLFDAVPSALGPTVQSVIVLSETHTSESPARQDVVLLRNLIIGRPK